MVQKRNLLLKHLKMLHSQSQENKWLFDPQAGGIIGISIVLCPNGCREVSEMVNGPRG
jgi:hypothetical protein